MNTVSKFASSTLSTGWVVLMGVCLAFSAATPVRAAGRRPSDVPAGEHAKLVKVIDGETLQVTINGALATVKYIGIDAPNGAECFAAQATRANANLVSNQVLLVLEKDAQASDEAGNLLRYVYLIDGRMVNEELAGAGLARATANGPNAKNVASIFAFAREAQNAKRGAWRSCKWQPMVQPGVCPVLQVEDLIARVGTFSELGMLQNGDCVTIHKAANPSGPAWSGQYIFHPKGSRVKLGNLYVRWKDGFVAILAQADGTFLAHVNIDHKRKLIIPANPSPTNRPRIQQPYTERTTKTLVRDAADASVLRIPDNAWLFREVSGGAGSDVGNGGFIALVDVFEYKSGDFRVPDISAAGYVL